MKVCIIMGTRPEIVKGASLVRHCEKKGTDYFILHTGQHYSYELSKLFFEELELPEPKYNMEGGRGTFRFQVGAMLRGIEEVLRKERPDTVLVIGDTNSVLAGALAGNKLNIKVGHVEAGLRSHDIQMLEETNRIITDHVSDFMFAPTEEAKKNLTEEGLDEKKIYVTGNTVVDALVQHREMAERKADTLKKLDLKRNKYMVMTINRAENVDFRDRFKETLKGLDLVHKKFGLPLVWPVHPRAQKMLSEFGLDIPEGIRLIDPLGYLEFLQLQSNARLVLTDSGGIQEESCALKVPCVTVRDSTERPETIKAGSNVISTIDSEKILESADIMINKKRNWENPYGDGRTAERIFGILEKSLD